MQLVLLVLRDRAGHSQLGLLGGVATVVLAAGAGVSGDGAVVRGAAEELRGVLGVLEGAALDRELLFSGGFTSGTCNRAGSQSRDGTARPGESQEGLTGTQSAGVLHSSLLKGLSAIKLIRRCRSE